MKDKWTNDIKDRVEETRLKAPDHLLDDIKAEMARRGLEPGRPAQPQHRAAPVSQRRAAIGSPRRAAIVPLRLATVAAVAAIVIVGGILVNRYMTTDGLQAMQTAERTAGQAASPSVQSAPSAMQSASSAMQSASSAMQSAPSIELASSSEQAASPSEQAASPSVPASSSALLASSPSVPATSSVPLASSSAVPSSSPSPLAPSSESASLVAMAPQDASASSSPVGASHHRSLASSPRQTANRHSRFSFGTAFGAAPGSDASQGILMTAADPMGNFDPNFGSDKLNDKSPVGTNPDRHTHYNRPVKLGVSVNYRLSNRWNLYSGVTYSYLKSKTTYSSSTQTEKQHLHYVGVPLGVSYTIYGKNRLRVYAAAGGEAQKLVSGHVTVKDDITGKHKESVSEHRPQFSVGAALGAEYQFSKHLGVYVEPSVTHHFDNGSSVDNVYKDQPTKVNVGFGLRLHIK